MRLIIHAPLIYTGGGSALLISLLEALSQLRVEFTEVLAILDRRFGSSRIEDAAVKIVARVDPNLLSWFLAERKLASTSRPEDVVLCLASLPPLLKTRGFVITFVQNTYVAASDTGFTLTWRRKLPVMFQQIWFRLTRTHTDVFAVQTISMRDRLVDRVGIKKDRVMVTPFLERPNIHQIMAAEQPSKQWDFGYISLPWPHKNHRRLIEAFIMLAEAGVTPSLVMTVPDTMDPKLSDWIKEVKRKFGVRITNLGHIDYHRIGEIYRAMGALIFPSLSESFALPLLEAKSYNVPILAAERDYVRDVVVPMETFDPESPRSIMRAILRFLGQREEPPFIPGAHEFVTAMSRMAKAAKEISN